MVNKEKMYALIIIVISLFSVINCYSQEYTKYDPKAADRSGLLDNSIYVSKYWDSVNNKGYGVLKSGEIVWLKSWSSNSHGIECKVFINDWEYSVTQKNIKKLKEKVIEYGELFLKERELKALIEVDLEKDLNNPSSFSMDPEPCSYDMFDVLVRNVNVGTTVIIFYLNKK